MAKKEESQESDDSFKKCICKFCNPWQKCLLYSIPIFIALPFLIRKMICPPFCTKINKCFSPPPGCCKCKEFPKPP